MAIRRAVRARHARPVVARTALKTPDETWLA
jgi:hypothetical protein